jgi:hypothetical protein
MPPSSSEIQSVAAYEARYAKDSLGFVRWLMSADATDEMVATRGVLARDASSKGSAQ